MGSKHTRPEDFGEYALRGFIAESRGGLPWWQTCIASTLLDLGRVEGFVTAFSGIANGLRHGDDPRWVVGGDSARAAMDVALEWLDADIDPQEVSGWLRAGCWDPQVARRLIDAGIHPHRLLNEEGQPAHWLEVADGNQVPLATAITEWQFPVAEAVRIVTGRAYEVGSRGWL
jgi:hypothetical protein